MKSETKAFDLLGELDAFARRQERMRVALEAIQLECQHGTFGLWRERIEGLAALGLRRTP